MVRIFLQLPTGINMIFFYRVFNICCPKSYFFFYQISSRFLQSVSHVWHTLLYLYIFMIFSNQIQMFYAKLSEKLKFLFEKMTLLYVSLEITIVFLKIIFFKV